MNIKSALLMNQKPLVLSITISWDDYKNDSELIRVIADAVSFARAAHNTAQALVMLTKELTENQKKELTDYIKELVAPLQVEKEELIVQIDKINDRVLKLTITAA